ncbi:MAG: DUF1932 domain-containing protein [Pseudomonadota bacterium]|jgi:3-hydroxyisobutyrate dehydrogenase-like beta-hydroxyacid dehydrogenase|nr:DUF1932 domain-containing protein [Pseudomonadota bacterium]
MKLVRKIALIGFGEVGQILGEDLVAPEGGLTAFDIRFDEPGSPPMRAVHASPWVEAAPSAHEAVADADLIVSAVTAERTREAAQSVTGALRPETIYLDLNSASPGTKCEAARLVEAAGGRYIEAAVMSPLPPKRLGSPILLGGPHAEGFLPLGRMLGFTALRAFSTEFGQASAAKMCRSVVVKGMEALLSEALIAARHYSVEDTLLASLDDLFPGPDWPQLAHYMISRSLVHGRRRAEEMREVARTVSEAGLDPHMSTATAERQDWAGALTGIPDTPQLGALLDALAGAARRNGKPEAAR